MREHDDRALLRVRLRRAEKLSQASDDLGFRVQVQGRERVVQDQQPRRQRPGRRQRPCQRQALALAAGDADAQFADFRLQASRKGAQILTQGGTGHGRFQDWVTSNSIGGVVLSLTQGCRAQHDIVADGARKEIGVLGEIASTDGALGHRNVLQGTAIQ